MSDDEYVIHLLGGEVRVNARRELVNFEKCSLKDDFDLVMTITFEQAVDLAHALIRMAA